jgi:serine/threonine protein phosphatase PrpC
MSEHRYGLAYATTLSRKAVNQDAVRFLSNPGAGIAAVVVADGVGSHHAADFASRVVAESMADDLRMLESESDLHLNKIFESAHWRLKEAAEEFEETRESSFDWSTAFGTTAICAVETSRHLIVGYAGNGGVFHIRGNFNAFSPAQILPWNGVNYLNPHSRPVNGKNVLYKLISPHRSSDDVRPTIITLTKDDSRYGDIVLCCTDGIYSYDQVDVGRDDRQRVWVSGEETMERFYESLRRFFDDETSDASLTDALDQYLRGLNEAGLVTDDCSVGVLITQKATSYQHQLREQRNESVPA